MGFTIEDMLTIAQDQYEIELIAGTNGWANSISWIMMIEDLTILRSLSGKELAITTGLGFQTEDKLLELARCLTESHASGLIINIGPYIREIPPALIQFCDENDLPLLTVPWHVYLADMIKDLSMHLLFQGVSDQQISAAAIRAIENPKNTESYRKELLPHYNIDGQFQVVLLTTDMLDELDSVDRRKLSYRLQIYLENITHNGMFFYYDENFVLVLNDVTEAEADEIITGMLHRAKRRMPNDRLYLGIGSIVTDISNLSLSYQRAKSALSRARSTGADQISFDEMGIYRLLYSVSDSSLLSQMIEESLAPIIEYDQKHNSNYVETLHCYLNHNGSIQATSDELFTHRNTMIYRINNIKKILGTNFETAEEKIRYQIALYAYSMVQY